MCNFPSAPSRRTVYASRGMVASSQQLASQVGLYILREGGNAVDAAIAAAAALTVIEPTSNGIGSDAFAIVCASGELYGYNGSGRSPEGLGVRKMRDLAGGRSIPERGWAPVTVPGAPQCWVDLLRRFGHLPLKKVLQPAINYAYEGYPLSPVVAEDWRRGIGVFGQRKTREFQPWIQLFAPPGFSPRPGAVWSSAPHAKTLASIANSNAQSFYQGEIAEKIDAFARASGGWLRGEDLARHRGEWVDPISINHKGFDVWELPPNSQAIATLEALSILNGFLIEEEGDVGVHLHHQIESMKIALTDTFAHVGDDGKQGPWVTTVLDEAYISKRRAMIGDTSLAAAGVKRPASDTTYLCTADADGMMVSYIQSNCQGFGSGIVIPDTGISLQNRGHNFTMAVGHPNEYRPHKRPYHTLMPGFLTRQGAPIGSFGVTGGLMQPQGHLQLILSTIDYHLDPQPTLDAVRWRWAGGSKVRVERRMPTRVVQYLRSHGHDVEFEADSESASFGRGQIIWRRNGVLEGGSESRADGSVVGY